MSIDGTSGPDYLVGTPGDDDLYRVYGADDQVIEAAGQGTDVIFTSASYAIWPWASFQPLHSSSAVPQATRMTASSTTAPRARSLMMRTATAPVRRSSSRTWGRAWP